MEDKCCENAGGCTTIRRVESFLSFISLQGGKRGRGDQRRGGGGKIEFVSWEKKGNKFLISISAKKGNYKGKGKKCRKRPKKESSMASSGTGERNEKKMHLVKNRDLFKVMCVSGRREADTSQKTHLRELA